MLAEPGVLHIREAWVSYLLLLVAIAGIGWLGWSVLAEEFPTSVAWLHPPVLITGYVLFLMGLPGLFLYFAPEFFGILHELRYDYFSWGMALVAGGLVSLWCGYLLTVKLLRPSRTLQRLGAVPLSMSVVIGLYALTIVFRLARVLVAGVAYDAHGTGAGLAGGWDQWFAFLESTRYLVLALVTVRVFQGRSSRWLLIGILGTEAVYALTSGFTKPMFWVIVVTLVAALYAGVKLSQYTRYLVVLGVVGVLMVPVTEGLRLAIQARAFDTRSPAAVWSSTIRIAESMWAEDASVGWETFMTKAPGRFAFVAYMPGLMMSRTPSTIPHLGFGDFLEVPLYTLPRAIWQDKPAFSRGRWFSIHYLDMPGDTDSSTAVTVFGESYLFAGWTTMLLALLVLGVMLAVLGTNTIFTGLAPVYIAMLPGIIDIEMEFTAKFVTLVQGGAFVLAVYVALVGFSWITHRPAADTGRSPAFRGGNSMRTR